MTTTTDTSTPLEVDDDALAYADTLVTLAASIRAGAIPAPTSRLRVYLTSWSLYRDAGAGRAAFVAARRAFPDATVEVSKDYVEIHVGERAVLLFDKATVGTEQTVTRDVVEYVIDPELLAPVQV